ncbi:MAG: hypothetical protein H6621_12005 [Halobacteriovoraceae bacterium]|nr:hypothetical protein [Halobacteriovoraceae bacterium]MCB9095785.1 hypothetical protein [Halobacteriovoraceae bacterium]
MKILVSFIFLFNLFSCGSNSGGGGESTKKLSGLSADFQDAQEISTDQLKNELNSLALFNEMPEMDEHQVLAVNISYAMKGSNTNLENKRESFNCSATTKMKHNNYVSYIQYDAFDTDLVVGFEVSTDVQESTTIDSPSNTPNCGSVLDAPIEKEMEEPEFVKAYRNGFDFMMDNIGEMFLGETDPSEKITFDKVYKGLYKDQTFYLVTFDSVTDNSDPQYNVVDTTKSHCELLINPRATVYFSIEKATCSTKQKLKYDNGDVDNTMTITGENISRN